MGRFLSFVCAASAVLLLQACASSPTSEVLGQRYFVTNLDTYPVQIASVDGTSDINLPMRVDPGSRRLVIQGPPGGAGFSWVQTMQLEVAPCTRYYIVAVKANRLDTVFTPKVDYQEALPSCKPAAS